MKTMTTKNLISLLINRRVRKRYLIICKLLDIKPREKILDVGCGKDGRSFQVYNNTNPIIGIDLFSREELKISRTNFTYIQHNAIDLSIFKNNEFDVAISIGMFEHICNEKIEKVYVVK